MEMMSKFLTSESEDDVDILHRSTAFYKYASIPVLHNDLENGKPISLLQMVGGTFGCVVSPNVLAKICCIGETNVSKAGFQFMEWELNNDEELFQSVNIARSCLLLPSQVTGEGRWMYACITDSWQCWDGVSKFVPPVPDI
jgi:hypothetical protein